MTTEEKAKAYDKALEQAKKELNTCGSLDCDAARQIFRFFPQLRESEKPLTPFQQCLNLILRKVYFASIPNTEDINKFILDIVKNHTSELVELAKRHEYTDCQLRESEDLEEAAEEWCKANNKGIALCADKKSHYLAEGMDAFKAGAEWMKQKMMEGAEECELYWDGDFLAIDLNMRTLGYSERDKVKIIIVKEDNNGH